MGDSGLVSFIDGSIDDGDSVKKGIMLRSCCILVTCMHVCECSVNVVLKVSDFIESIDIWMYVLNVFLSKKIIIKYTLR